MSRVPLVLMLGALLLTPVSAAAEAQTESDARPLNALGYLEASPERTATGTAQPAPKMRSSSFRLPDVRPLAVDSIGPQLRGLARPTALAAGDFDEDGVPDLVSGYTGAGGHLVTLHRGNVDAIHPNSPEARKRKVAGTFTDEPFLTPARIFELPATPDRLGAGDFDNDGHWDVVAAAIGGNALYLLPGDGHGNLGPARIVTLEGNVTAMLAGEINRRDGLTDLIVGIQSEQGFAVLVFQGPEGALDRAPEIVALPAAPTALALGHLDDQTPRDLALAAGSELMILRGRYRWLSLSEKDRVDVAPATVETILELDSAIASIAVGDYVWNGNLRQELALLSTDGVLHLLGRDGIYTWQKIGEHPVVSKPVGGSLLTTVRVSGLPMQELVVLDRSGRSLYVTLGEVRAEGGIAPDLGRSLSAALDGAPIAALPMRLNRDALSDLVLLLEGTLAPVVAASAPASVIVVDDATDSGPAAGDGYCRLSEAIANANSNTDTSGGDCAAGAGADTIQCVVPKVDVLAALPAMTDPGDAIDGTTDCANPPCLELAGNLTYDNGLTIEASSIAVRGLVINNFVGDGIRVQAGASGVIVEGNFIGTDTSGTLPMGNFSSGVTVIGSSSNTIGGTTLPSRNVISGSYCGGVVCPGIEINSSLNEVQGNYIGTDVTGAAHLGNTGSGVAVVSEQSLVSADNLIGGTVPGAGNVISGNGFGIAIASFGTLPLADDNIVQGNLIGLDATGMNPLGNVLSGVIVQDSSSNLIGGAAVAARNVISDNGQAGVAIVFHDTSPEDVSDNVVQGNYVGTDASGSVAVGNVFEGVAIEAGHDNLVGGVVPGEGNVVSGNERSGVRFGLYADDNKALGNFIGTDASGNVALGNGHAGAEARESGDNRIGGPAAGEGNIISGNVHAGVLILGSTAVENKVQGNHIGTDSSGTTAIPNLGPGVLAESGLSSSIGGTDDGAGNLITGNTGGGVVIQAGLYHSILGNSIFDNEDIGIDLGGDGVTPNDGAGDPDFGANALQNFPMLVRADSGLAETVIRAGLVSTASTTFRVEYFANASCDPSGFGEGRTFLGSIDATTLGGGAAPPFTIVVPTAVPVGYQVTATATDSSGNTSEFSECFPVSACTLEVFGQTLLAQDEGTLVWAAPADAKFVKGPLGDVDIYATTEDGLLTGATSLDISGDDPGGGTGMYYLLRLQACGSWQTLPAAEPDRDTALQ